MDGQRPRQYYPGLPLAGYPQPGAQGMLSVPPPPPRPIQATHQSLPGPPPPPPGPPPGSNYGMYSGWQQNWSRQAGHPYPPPPPPQPSSHQPHNQHLAYSAPQNRVTPAPLSIPHTTNDHPQMSATYIPTNSDSFGPGVGIPPLVEFRDLYHQQGYSYHDEPTNLTSSYEQAGQANKHHGSGQLWDPNHTSVAPSASQHDLPPQFPQKYAEKLNKDNSYPHNAAPASSGSSTHELDEKWSIDRILQWLKHNGFSTSWQNAFKALDLKGTDFLKLDNLDRIRQDFFPQLAREYAQSGLEWDQTRENMEGFRLRKLIQSIKDSKDPAGRYYGGNLSSVASPSTDDWRKASPSTSSEHGTPAEPRPFASRSRRESPGAQFAQLDYSPGGSHNKRYSSESMPSAKQNGKEMPSKDHKGFLNRLRWTRNSAHPSPEELYIESPTSPMMKDQYPNSPYNKPRVTGTEHERLQHRERRLIQASPPPKRYLFVTLDGCTYRLIDVTDVDAADTLRARLCTSVGIKDPASATIYVTEPGKVVHEEPLSDTMLVINRRYHSDAQGTLKLYIQPIPLEKGRLNGYNATNDDRLGAPANKVSPALGRRQSHNGLSLTPPFPSGEDESKSDAEMEALMSAKRKHDQEVELKRRKYFDLKQQKLRNEDTASTPAPGIKRRGVIDFDERRDLVPLRKPPTAPSESNTLSKVNSLSKQRGERTKTPSDAPPSPSVGLGINEGIHAALAGVGKFSSFMVNTSGASASNHSHSPRTPSGSDFVKPACPFSDISGSPKGPPIPERRDHTKFMAIPYSQVDPAGKDASESTGRASRQGHSPVTPPAEKPPPLQSRKSNGPDVEFQGNEVSFAKSPLPQQGSDSDDSDQGLFAIPLANKKNKLPTRKSTLKKRNRNDQSQRPTLTVDTTSRASKVRSVTFKSPMKEAFALSAVSEYSNPRSGHQSSEGNMDESPVDPRAKRRESFVRDDVWASRPPVEGMIDHLDDFFPNIDLDEPYLEAVPLSPPISPSSTRNENENEGQTLRDHASQGTSTMGSFQSQDTGTLGSDESTLKANKPAPNTVAQRNLSRSGGLTRMKSIREVAKGAHQVTRNRSIASGNAKANIPLRRKSTKMFGAKIMQISPRPGSRLSQLDPIPKPPEKQSTSLQRQPTFRIVRGQLIGKGTYGRVYLGINADTGEILAVKQVDVNQKAAGYDKDRIKEMMAAIDQEIDTMQHLEHRNIVQYLGCERGELSISIYLEYIPGGSIGSCLRKHGKFEESVVKSLTYQTLDGLAYLHDKGILHRDLKADNILLDLDGTCKISDFGISKKTDNIYGNDVENTMQGSVFWMAPEVVQSQCGYSAKVDIWSLGCVVLEMFAGRRPWSKDEAIGAIFKLGTLKEGPPIPEDVSMNISPTALSFMFDCFTVEPSDRPTAETLISKHPFCKLDPSYDFLDTELHAKIRHVL